MRTLIDILQLQHPIAACNGGLFVRPDLSVIHEHVIPGDAVPIVVDILTKHTLTAWSYTGTEWRVPSRLGAHVDREAWTVKFAPVVAPARPTALDHLIKIVGVTDDSNAMARAVDEIQRTCGEFVSAALSQPYYLDVTHPKANKGEVVGVLSGLLNIPAAQIATIGDMPNDILMFQRSGMSIAMANASVEV
jgi:hydroxymethylpyrimidine pyrophosphatase-like HAD family hydrolase